MKHVLLSFTLLVSVFTFAQTSVFINELHYDNSGGDTDEGFEIAGPAGTNLSGWKVILYNGSSSQLKPYGGDVDLSGVIPDESNGFGALYFAKSGIQNGAPDGLVLLDPSNTVVQFLSYEGSFTAAEGVATGMTSTDIGVAESSSTPSGESLQLVGSGNTYEDFTWQAPATRSDGAINTGQTFLATGGPTIPTVFFEISGSNQIQANYSEAMDNTAIDAANYSGIPGNLSLSFNGAQDVVTITSDQDLPVGVSFTVTVDNVTDQEGDALTGPFNQDFLYNPITSGLVITEIYYNQPGSDDYEYFEVYNNTNAAIPLGGLTITQGVTGDFPAISLPAGAYLVFCDDIALFQSDISNTLPYLYEWNSGALTNGGEDIEITNTEGDVVAYVDYDDGGDWPGAADGSGPSLEIIDVNADQNDPTNWFACQTFFGTVNGEDFSCTPGFLGGYTPPFSINSGYIIDKDYFALRFNREIDPNEIDNSDFVASFPGQLETFVTFGDSAIFKWSEDFPSGTAHTLVIDGLEGLDNTDQLAPFVMDITVNFSRPQLVVTEIMYNPPESGTDNTEFIEIYNAGSQPAQLGGLTFEDGFDFDLPFMSLAPGEFLLIGENEQELEALFPGTDFYEWDGALGNGGETLVLENSAGQTVFSVSYDDADGWPQLADGLGSSLELIETRVNGQNASDWRATPNLTATAGSLKYYATPGSLPFPVRTLANIIQDSVFQFENNVISIPVGIKNNDKGLSFDVRLTDGTAAGSDYRLLSPSSVSLDAGVKQYSIEIALAEDKLKESMEHFTVSISNPRNARIVSQQSTVYIGDANQTSPELCINEFLAVNASFADPFGTVAPWVEIHNPNSTGVNLNGFSLTTSVEGAPISKTISGQLTVPANGFVVLWLDSLPANGSNHLSTTMDTTGGTLVLTDLFGTIADQYTYSVQSADVSEGRQTDCGEPGAKFGNPTPGTSNTGVSIEEWKKNAALGFWPNPVQDVAHRKAQDATKQWVVYSVDGQQVALWLAGQTQLNTTTLHRGVYWIKDGNGNFIGKMLRQ